MAENLFTHWVFTDYVLPWLLVFVLLFAILEKSKLLGEGKKQINAIIAAVCGLILLAFPVMRDYVTGIVPYLVVGLVILFVFMLLYSFISGETKGDPLGKNLKIILGVAAGIAVIVVALYLSGAGGNLWDFMKSEAGANIIFIILAIAAVAVVVRGGEKKGD